MAKTLGQRLLVRIGRWFSVLSPATDSVINIGDYAKPHVETDSEEIPTDPKYVAVEEREALIEALKAEYTVNLSAYVHQLKLELVDMVIELDLDENSIPDDRDPILTYDHTNHQAMIDTRFPVWMYRMAIAMFVARVNAHVIKDHPDMRDLYEDLKSYEVTADMIMASEGPSDNRYWEDHQFAMILMVGDLDRVRKVVQLFGDKAFYGIQRVFSVGPVEAAIMLRWADNTLDPVSPQGMFSLDDCEDDLPLKKLLLAASSR